MVSLDDGLPLGEKQNRLMKGILIYKKTLEEIAEEEGVEVKVIRMRLHFLCKKLIEHHEKKEKEFREQKFDS